MSNFSGFLINSVSVVFVFTKPDDVLVNGKKQKDRRLTVHSSRLKNTLYDISDLCRCGWKMIGIFPDPTRDENGRRLLPRGGKPKEQNKDKYTYGIPEKFFRVEAGTRVIIMEDDRPRYNSRHRMHRQWTMKKKLERVHELVKKGTDRKEAIREAIKIQYVEQ